MSKRHVSGWQTLLPYNTHTYETVTDSLLCVDASLSALLSALPASTGVIPTISQVITVRLQSQVVARPVFEPKHSGSGSVFLTSSCCGWYSQCQLMVWLILFIGCWSLQPQGTFSWGWEGGWKWRMPFLLLIFFCQCRRGSRETCCSFVIMISRVKHFWRWVGFWKVVTVDWAISNE